jgi:IS30 family transposase
MTRRFTDAERKTIWDLRDAGVPVKRIARHLGRQNSSLRRFIADAGGSARNHENALSCGCR